MYGKLKTENTTTKSTAFSQSSHREIGVRVGRGGQREQKWDEKRLCLGKQYSGQVTFC